MDLQPVDNNLLQSGGLHTLRDGSVQTVQSAEKSGDEWTVHDESFRGEIIVQSCYERKRLHGGAGEQVVGRVQVVEEGSGEQVFAVQVGEGGLHVDGEPLDVRQVETVPLRQSPTGLPAGVETVWSDAALLHVPVQEDVNQVRLGSYLPTENCKQLDLLALGGTALGEAADEDQSAQWLMAGGLRQQRVLDLLQEENEDVDDVCRWDWPW